MSGSEPELRVQNAKAVAGPMRVIVPTLAALAVAAGLFVQLAAVVVAAHAAADTSANVLAGLSVVHPGATAKTNTQLLRVCLGLQAAAAVLVAGGSARLMPLRYRTPRIPLFGYLC
jgi:hypothetical protein